MILVIGSKNCSKCKTVKGILDDKKIEYTYKIIDDFTGEEQSSYLKMAKEKGLLSFPLIIKDNNIINLQEV